MVADTVSSEEDHRKYEIAQYRNSKNKYSPLSIAKSSSPFEPKQTKANELSCLVLSLATHEGTRCNGNYRQAPSRREK